MSKLPDKMDNEKRQQELPILLQQGARAVRSGNFGERMVEAGFAAYGVKIFKYDPVYRRDSGELWARKNQVLIQQYLEKKGLKIDWMYRDYPRGIALPIEHKQQKGTGTTDEKLAYTVDRLVRCGCKGFWLILSGNGFNQFVINEIDRKIRTLPNIKGRLITSHESMLQRRIELLVEQGEI